MKKLLALLIALMLALSVLAACAPIDIDTTIPSNFQNSQASKPSDDDVPTNAPTVAEEITIVGSWAADVDLAPLMNRMFADELDADLADYLRLDRFRVVMQMQFREDGTYYVDIDEASYQNAVENMVDLWVDGFTRYMEDQNISVGEFEEEMGVSLETFVRDSLSEGLLETDFESDGTYTLDGDRLQTDDDECFVIELTARTMMFVDYVSDEAEEQELYERLLKGMVFRKQ